MDKCPMLRIMVSTSHLIIETKLQSDHFNNKSKIHCSKKDSPWRRCWVTCGFSKVKKFKFIGFHWIQWGLVRNELIANLWWTFVIKRRTKEDQIRKIILRKIYGIKKLF